MNIDQVTSVFASAVGSQAAQTSAALRARSARCAAGKPGRTSSQSGSGETADAAELNGQVVETDDRDADGRSAWEFDSLGHKKEIRRQSADEFIASNDPSGNSGTSVDLTG
jgi:hypothetical protein